MEATSENPWAPFEDRVAFDFAQYHYVELQSSEGEIMKGLDLLTAVAFKYGFRDGALWKSAKELYATIDSIQTSNTPWRTYKFRYNGPKPATPPRWMEEDYDLNLRDILMVFEEHLASSEFKEESDFAPYMEFDPQGNRVYSNLMSANWVHRHAVIFLKLSCSCADFFCIG
jgi:Plavaka transposase